MLSASTCLRAAAVVALLQFLAHGTMFVRSRPKNGPSEEAVVDAMKRERFNFAGAMRSYWDMYFGYGIFAAVFCLVEAVLFWQLAGAAAPTAATIPLVRSIVALFTIVNVAHIGLVARYFFFVPAVPDALIAIALGLAWLRL
jgi:hypothetical protein